MRLGCVAIIGGLYLLWSGGQGLYTAATNWSPYQVSCQDYGTVRPTAEWLELERCSMSLMEASYTERGGKAVELFLPARGENDADGAPVMVLVATKDEELLELANQLIQIEDDGALIRFAVDNHDQIFPVRDVRGLVRYGVDLDDDERAELKKLDATLGEGFVILDEGKRPGVLRSAAFFAGGAILVLVSGGALAGAAGAKG